MTVVDATAILTLFEQMLLAMETRFIARDEDTRRLEAGRWEAHLHEHTVIDTHLREVHEDELVVQARVRPVRNTFVWLADHWRDVVLLAIGLVALATLITDRLLRAPT
jgi:hypothetical protein